jgi:hypothetical protein
MTTLEDEATDAVIAAWGYKHPSHAERQQARSVARAVIAVLPTADVNVIDYLRIRGLIEAAEHDAMGEDESGPHWTHEPVVRASDLRAILEPKIPGGPADD